MWTFIQVEDDNQGLVPGEIALKINRSMIHIETGRTVIHSTVSSASRISKSNVIVIVKDIGQ